jgi:hypothetical protein
MSWVITGREAGPADPFIGSVSLLLHGNGTNGSTTITDSSPTPKTVTAVGNAQISTAQSKFGGASIAFDGTGDWLTTPNSSAFDLPGDFTVECFCRFNALSASLGSIAGKWLSTGSNLAWLIQFDESRILFVQGNSGSFNSSLSCNVTITTGVWYHIAFARVGTTLRGFLDGIAVGTQTTSNNLTGSTSLFIGANQDNTGQALNGYIDDLRITKGIARYTANFTPPTAPFPDI